MAQNKNQHYVPRCYFKPFSFNKEGVVINMLNISSERLVEKASIGNQCSKNYFYGKDLRLENMLSKLEAIYSRVVAKLERDKILSNDDLDVLRSFAFLQHMRTDQSIKTAQRQINDLNSAISNNGIDGEHPQLSNLHEDVMIQSMKMWLEFRSVMDDLEICVCVANSKHEFITSDDPSIFTSKFILQKTKQHSFGFGSAGALFFLPLCPLYLLMCYDKNVYNVSLDKNKMIKLKKQDIYALNELQILRSSNNLYFYSWESGSNVFNQLTMFRKNRPKAWNETVVLVKDEGVEDTKKGTHYKVGADEEISEASETLILQSSYHPKPSKWPSFLKYKYRPVTLFDGSALGHVRKTYNLDLSVHNM